MRYMLSIYVDPESPQGEMADWWAFNEDAGKAGVLLAGDALEAPSTSTTVRLRGGERLLTDGPFAETKEQLGGFYILDCKDLDEALSWAERIPSLRHTGAVEVAEDAGEDGDRLPRLAPEQAVDQALGVAQEAACSAAAPLPAGASSNSMSGRTSMAP